MIVAFSAGKGKLARPSIPHSQTAERLRSLPHFMWMSPGEVVALVEEMPIRPFDPLRGLVPIGKRIDGEGLCLLWYDREAAYVFRLVQCDVALLGSVASERTLSDSVTVLATSFDEVVRVGQFLPGPGQHDGGTGREGEWGSSALGR